MNNNKKVTSCWDKMHWNMDFLKPWWRQINQQSVTALLSQLQVYWLETYTNHTNIIKVWSNVMTNICTVSIVIFVVKKLLLVAIEVFVQIL